MSADSWDACPRCKQRHEQLMTTKALQLEQGYGTMPQEKWLALKKEVDDPPLLDDSLKEYHEQGLIQKADGTWEYYVRYHGTCNNDGCGFEIKKEIDEAIDV